MKERKNDTSRFLALILRHRPDVIGITLDEHGWADTDALIKGIAAKQPFDRKMLEEIVATDEKMRYSFNEDGTKIRANQGHSVKVDVELTEQQPPEFLYHGTGEKYVPFIDKEGLKPQSRLYVHLSADHETAVKVGTRHGRPVVYKVHTGEMREYGYRFFISANGVWLTDRVPPVFLEKLSEDEIKGQEEQE